MTPDHYHLDKETFSEIELSDVGAYRYAEDPSTEVLMMSISRNEGPVYLWINPDYRGVVVGLHDVESEDLLYDLENDPKALVYAHNAQFERAVAMFCPSSPIRFMRERPSQWRCTAALCRRTAIPDSLDKSTAYLNLSEKKDAKGKALIKLFSVPQTPRKKKGESVAGAPFRVYPKDEPAKFHQFGEYCRQDTVSEKLLHKAIQHVELRGPALQGFLLDIHLNDRGIPVDVPTLHNAKRIIDEMMASKFHSFTSLTGLQPTQRDAVKEWLEEQGCQVENMQAETLDEKIAEYEKSLLDPLLTQNERNRFETCGTVMRLYTDLSFAAVKKVSAMLDCVNRDGRIRGTLMFNGTGPGRSSARLVQPQNLKKAEINPAEIDVWTPNGVVKQKWPKGALKPTEVCYELLRRGADADEINALVAEPLEAIASSIRHFIPATLDADYAGLQARVVCWLAGQEDALQRFRDNIDAYRVLASSIFNKPTSQIDNPSMERDLGKVGILGCGFQMGPPKFLQTCHFQYGLTWVTPSLAARAVEAYRSTHGKVQQFWWDNDRMARRAITQPGRRFAVNEKISYECRHHAGKLFLFARLPSGREIAYADPKIETWVNKKTGESKEDSITYYGKPTIASGATGSVWMRIPTYGGKLTENVTMGVEADLINHGVSLAIDNGFDPFVLIHDQALAERKDGQTAPHFAACLADLPPWAQGLPLKVEAKFCKYYAK
jgi:DNA polymerase